MQHKRNTQTSFFFGSLIIAFAASAVALHMIASPVACAGDLTMAEFQELHEQLQVSADKPWRTIPWKTAMLDAQHTAAQQAKPIFIWAMDGHPLGCT
ncbi:MAG: hypothetical protein H8E66_17025 [Planctomycetes bacterium]|nr:hypothetical protein [Planctomycetota bacterium]